MAEIAPFLMVVAIVAIVSFTRLQRARYGIVRDRHGNETPIADPDSAKMRDEIRTLKDRIAVLERIATDGSASLDREIEQLRSRD